jgi:hypothetical protein
MPLLDWVRVPSRSPVSTLLCSPPTSCLHWPWLRFPLPLAYLDAGACSVPQGPTTRAPATCRASETTHRLSAKPEYVEERRGPPRLRGRPLRTCHGQAPRRIPSLPCPLSPGKVVAFDAFWNSRHPERSWFRGRSLTARTFACLRIAGRVSTTGARLTTDLGGLTLSRAGFAPARRHTKFHEGIASSNPNWPAGPGRTNIPCRSVLCGVTKLVIEFSPVEYTYCISSFDPCCMT